MFLNFIYESDIVHSNQEHMGISMSWNSLKWHQAAAPDEVLHQVTYKLLPHELLGNLRTTFLSEWMGFIWFYGGYIMGKKPTKTTGGKTL